MTRLGCASHIARRSGGIGRILVRPVWGKGSIVALWQRPSCRLGHRCWEKQEIEG